jgi:phenol hydroxylase P1 protein
VRRLVEDTFVERDWFHLYVAQTLGVNGVLLDFIYKRAEPAWVDAGLTVAMLTEFMQDWRTEESRWSDSVVKVVAAESGHNKALISQWAAHWIARAVEAATPLSEALLGDGGQAAIAAGEAARLRAVTLGLAL